MLSDETKSNIRRLTIKMVREAATDAETQEIAMDIRRLSPDPYYLDYIFYPEDDGPLEELIERALARVEKYKPFAL